MLLSAPPPYTSLERADSNSGFVLRHTPIWAHMLATRFPVFCSCLNSRRVAIVQTSAVPCGIEYERFCPLLLSARTVIPPGVASALTPPVTALQPEIPGTRSVYPAASSIAFAAAMSYVRLRLGSAEALYHHSGVIGDIKVSPRTPLLL